MVRASKVDYARGVPRAGMEEDTLAFAVTALSPSQRELGREHHKQQAEHQGIDGEPSHECGELLHRREQYGQPPKQPKPGRTTRPGSVRAVPGAVTRPPRAPRPTPRPTRP